MTLSLRRGPALLLAATFVLTPLAATVSSLAHAQTDATLAADLDSRQRYDIPAGPLGSVLSQFAGESGLLLSANASLTRGKTSAGLQGSYTAAEALQQLLAGTGLRYQVTDPRSVTLEPVPVDAHAVQLGTVTVTGDQPTAVASYNVPAAPTSTKLRVPLRDLPQAVSVVPEQVLEDQQIIRLGDIAHNVAGVTRRGGYGGNVDNFNIRGFAPNDILKNGFRTDSFVTMTEMANVESVQVLKGPVGALYGQNEPGGMVNVVTKKPLFTPYNEVSMTVGSEDLVRTTADLTGPLGERQDMAYRLNLAVEDANGFRDHAEHEQYFVAPAFTWNLSDATSLTVEAEFLRFDGTFDRGFRPEPKFFELPLDRFLGESWNNRESSQTSLGYELLHEIDTGLTFRHAVQGTVAEGDILQAQPFMLQADGRTLPRGVNKSEEETLDLVMQNELLASFQTGSVQHDAVVGFELGRETFEYVFETGALAPIDIFNPVYGAQPGVLTEVNWNEKQSIDSAALYLHDLISLNEQWKLLLGGRFERFNVERESLATGETTMDEQYHEFTPRAGIVYQPVPTQSLFLSYSQSFNPDIFSTTRDGSPLEPTTARQYEAGLKSDWMNERLSTTVSGFYIVKEDIATPDPIDPNFSVQTGEVTSRGVELEAAGELLPGLRTIANYAYTEAYVSKDNSLPEGDRLVNVPRNAASLWNVYEFADGALRGFSLGGGVFYVGEREGRLANNDVVLPSYVRVDAMAAYRWDTWKAQLSVKNLFDEEIYDSQGFFIEPGAPRTYLLNVSKSF